MSIMDLMAQGAPPPEGAPPPAAPPGEDPMAALMGAAPGGEPYAEEAPPGIAEEEAGAEEAGDESTDVQEAIEALQRAINRPTTDNQEMAVYQTCIANLQKQLGQNEKAMDNALGTNPQLRKALAGGGGA